MEHGCRDPVDPAPLARALNLGGPAPSSCLLPVWPACAEAVRRPCCAAGWPRVLLQACTHVLPWRCNLPHPPRPLPNPAADHAVQQDGQEFMKLFLSLLEGRFAQQPDLRDIIQAGPASGHGLACSTRLLPTLLPTTVCAASQCAACTEMLTPARPHAPPSPAGAVPGAERVPHGVPGVQQNVRWVPRLLALLHFPAVPCCHNRCSRRHCCRHCG